MVSHAGSVVHAGFLNADRARADVLLPRARTAPAADVEHDHELDAALSAARAGHEWGFGVLYRELQPRLLRYATALVGTEAEDVTAEAWLHVARDLHRFQGDVDGFRGWVCTICRNRAVDAMRLRNRRPVVLTDLDTLDRVGQGDTALDALDGISTREAIAMIVELPRQQAEAVLLRAVVGLDATQAGAVLGRRPGTVRVAAHRGLKRLAELLESREEGR